MSELHSVDAEVTELKVEDPAVMFGVGAYDAAGNELDTLDGVKLSWFIGKNYQELLDSLNIRSFRC